MSKLPNIDNKRPALCEELTAHLVSTTSKYLTNSFDELNYLLKHHDEPKKETEDLEEEEEGKGELNEEEEEERKKKEVETELAYLMRDVIGANEIHNKIFYCELYILVSTITTMILGVIDVLYK